MNTPHRNASLTVHGRDQIVARGTLGQGAAEVAQAFGISVPRCAGGRFREDGPAAPQDRPRSSHQVSARLCFRRKTSACCRFRLSCPALTRPPCRGRSATSSHPRCADARYATDAVRMMLGYEVICCGVQRIFAWLDPANTGWGGVVESMRLRRGTHLLQNDCFGGVGATNSSTRYSSPHGGSGRIFDDRPLPYRIRPFAPPELAPVPPDVHFRCPQAARSSDAEPRQWQLWAERVAFKR